MMKKMEIELRWPSIIHMIAFSRMLTIRLDYEALI